MSAIFPSPHMALLQNAHASLVRPSAAARPAKTAPVAFTLAPTPQSAVESVMPAAYRVRQGDTLSHIARQHLKAAGEDPSNAQVYAAVQRIAESNGLRNPDMLQPGQQLDLRIIEPKTSPAATAAAPVAAAASPRALAAPARGEARLERVLPPQDLLRDLRNSRLDLERARDSTPVEAQGGPSSIPAAEQTSSRIDDLLAQLRDSMQALSNEPWGPVLGGEGRLTSGYGMRRDPFTGRQRFHHGIDLAAPIGTPILAPQAGTVAFSGWRPGYGNLVELRHEDGSITRYGHNSENAVRRGEKVAAGSMIAKVGSTGRSTGPHVHFEVRREGRSVNPMPFLEAAGVRMAAAHSK